MQAAENELKQLNEAHRSAMTALKEELYEKTTLYEEMGERHLAEMRQKQAEMDEEVEACSRIYTAKLNELQSSNHHHHDNEDEDGQSWNKEREDITDNPQDFQRTPTHQVTTSSDQPAQLNIQQQYSVPDINTTSSLMPSYTLEVIATHAQAIG